MFKFKVNEVLKDIQGEGIETSKNIKGKIKKIPLTIREALLNYLGANIQLQDNKESTWVWAIANQLNDEAKTEVEISDDKIEFLRRVIGDNKIFAYGPQGTKNEVNLYPPFVVGQLLEYLGQKED